MISFGNWRLGAYSVGAHEPPGKMSKLQEGRELV